MKISTHEWIDIGITVASAVLLFGTFLAHRSSAASAAAAASAATAAQTVTDSNGNQVSESTYLSELQQSNQLQEVQDLSSSLSTGGGTSIPSYGTAPSSIDLTPVANLANNLTGVSDYTSNIAANAPSAAAAAAYSSYEATAIAETNPAQDVTAIGQAATSIIKTSQQPLPPAFSGVMPGFGGGFF